MDALTHGCAPPDRTVFGREEYGLLFGGVDTHKDTLTVALIDPSGKRRNAITVANTVAGHGELVAWLAIHGPVERLVSKAPVAMDVWLRWYCWLPIFPWSRCRQH